MSLTWEYESQGHTVVTLPFCINDTDKTFNISLTSSEELINAFLYTDGDYSGIISAKRSTQNNYRSIEAYSETPSCYLGTIAADEKIVINMKANFSSAYKGEYVIPVYVGHGDDVDPEYFDNNNIFWRGNSTDDPFFWASSEEEADNDIWIGNPS
jgi:hypothetical protein